MSDFHLDPLINVTPTLFNELSCVVCELPAAVIRRWDAMPYCYEDAETLGVMNDPGGVDVHQSVYERLGFKTYG